MWQDELSKAFRNSRDLSHYLGHEIPKVSYPIFIPRSLAKRIKERGPLSSLWRQFVPASEESRQEGLNDPIGDQLKSVGGQLVHRYHNRALFLPTQVCPVLCRYCFRKNELNQKENLWREDLKETGEYLRSHDEIEEIIFTGGDPFVLSIAKLEKYLNFFAGISSIRCIRFHTRVPVILPSRIDDDLLDFFSRWKTRFRLIVSVHTNHVEEWTKEGETCLSKMAKLDLTLLAQIVLLKNVNDDSETLATLCRFLVMKSIRPYYLHHPDPVQGGMHFTIPLDKGYKIYSELRQKLSGWAIPQYVIDSPDGTGKAPIGFQREESSEFLCKNKQSR